MINQTERDVTTEYPARMAIPITRPELPPLGDYMELLRQIWSTKMLSNFATFAQRLESLVAEYLGVNARVVVSGDIGLTLAIAALRIPKGSSCLLPSFTFSSTANAVIWNGLKPLFVDVDARTLNIDAQAMRQAAAGAGVRLIVATHVFGNPADTDAIHQVASDIGAHVVYDAAHAYGSVRAGTLVGGFGDAEVFSLSGTKVVTSAEGGIITSRNPEFLDRISLLRGYGFLGDYNTKIVGLNGKMSELHAALGCLTLPRIENALVRRHGHLAQYGRRLSQIDDLMYQEIRPEDRSTYKDFAVVFPTKEIRERVETQLAGAGIQSKRYFFPCHRMDAFRQYAIAPLPVTDAIYGRILCLPLYEALTCEEIDVICDVVIGAVD